MWKIDLYVGLPKRLTNCSKFFFPFCFILFVAKFADVIFFAIEFHLARLVRLTWDRGLIIRLTGAQQTNTLYRSSGVRNVRFGTK